MQSKNLFLTSRLNFFIVGNYLLWINQDEILFIIIKIENEEKGITMIYFNNLFG